MQDVSLAAEEGEDPSGRRRPRVAVFLAWWLLPALVITTVIAGIAVAVKFAAVEEDIQSRVSARLTQAGLIWAGATVDGRDIVLTGTAPSVETRQAALDIAGGIWGVASVKDLTELIPLVTPFDWSVEREGGFVILAGYVPSEESRQTVRGLVTAILPQSAIDDRTELARGAPIEFQSGVEYALRILTNMTTGRVSLLGLDLTAEGLATDLPRYEAAVELAEDGPPSGLRLAVADFSPPLAVPYVLAVTVSEAVAVLSGSIPSTGAAERLATATLAAFAGMAVENRTALASGEPEAFEDMAVHVLQLASLLASGEVVLTDQALTISGRARSPEAYEELLALLAAAQPGGMTIALSDIAPSIAEAYVLEIVRSDDGVELIGFMPSDEARTELLSEAQRLLGGGRVIDSLQIADGAPRMDWLGAAKFALGQVAVLSGGSARISDHAYSITGAAATSAAYEALREELAGTLPASLVLNNALLTAPVESPYRFAAAVGPEAVSLSGAVPSPELRDLFAGQTGLRFATLGVADEMRLASGAPLGFEEVVLAGLQAISRLSSGRFELVDLAVTISGVAPYDGAIARIEDQLAVAVPDQFTVNLLLTAVPLQAEVSAAACQALLIGELGEGGIRFNEGSTAIAAESEGRLDRLVAILQRCPAASVEIGGHTDAAGTVARNQELSRIRAQAVVNYLVEAGVDAARLTAVGYGEANPIASNETEEGRAQNRRIEFRIVEL